MIDKSTVVNQGCVHCITADIKGCFDQTNLIYHLKKKKKKEIKSNDKQSVNENILHAIIMDYLREHVNNLYSTTLWKKEIRNEYWIEKLSNK